MQMDKSARKNSANSSQRVSCSRQHIAFKKNVAERKVGNPKFQEAYAQICDTIGDPWKFPPCIGFMRDLLLKPNLNVRERLVTTAFLYQVHVMPCTTHFGKSTRQDSNTHVLLPCPSQNGVSPWWINYYYDANSSLRDAAAQRDVRGMLAKFEEHCDRRNRKRKFHAYDLIHGRVCWLDGTPREQ